jgi:ribosomal protein S18 acetylase RimI-like enzyme
LAKIFWLAVTGAVGLDVRVTDAGLSDTESSDTKVSLRPLTRAEFDEWLPRQLAGYAEQIAASGAMPVEEAWEKARRDTARAFSAGYDTPRQVMFRVLAGEEPVGWLWLGVPGPDPDPLMAWVYDIEVDENYRGRGYGRAAMLAAEHEARARGMTSLGLNVFGQNTVARGLYESLGYEVTSLQMKKPV